MATAILVPCKHHVDSDAQCKNCSSSDDIMDFVASAARHVTGWSCRDAKYVQDGDRITVTPHSSLYSLTFVHLDSKLTDDGFIEVATLRLVGDGLDYEEDFDVVREW